MNEHSQPQRLNPVGKHTQGVWEVLLSIFETPNELHDVSISSLCLTDLQKPTVQPRWLRVTAFSQKLFRYTCPQLVEKLSIVCGRLAGKSFRSTFSQQQSNTLETNN